MGEHSVVYGRPALVAALGLYARARASNSGGHGVRLVLDDLGHHETVAWADLVALARATRADWESFAAARAPFRGLDRDDPAVLVKLALGEVAAELGPPASGLELRVTSEIPVGAGFGSSAAVAVAVLSAVLTWAGERAEPDRLERLALAVERRQHGTPSGVDHRTVLAGGLHRYAPGAEPALTPCPAGGLVERLALYHTGRPAESTGEVVAAVRRRRQSDPDAFDELVARMGAGVEALAAEVASDREDAARVTELIRGFERALEGLGVVPAPVRERIRRLEEEGAAAKISGAGALSGSGAGGLLVYLPPETPEPGRALAGLRRLRAPLGVQGAQCEVTA
ncbi:MAG: hypothetical protein R3325_06240 [Thermoanaerobaculia bacterium]|nr:hypothetical protein [Thermoanaerobaculia bacterium]